MTDVTLGQNAPLVFDDDAPAIKVRGYWATVANRLRYDYVSLFFAAVIIAIVLAAIFAPLIAPFDPNKTSMVYRLKPIGFRNFLLATDELCRAMLSRLIYGGRVSLPLARGPAVRATLQVGDLRASRGVAA